MAAPLYKRSPFNRNSSGILVASGANIRLSMHAMYMTTSGAAAITITDDVLGNTLINGSQLAANDMIVLPFSPVPWAITSGAIAAPLSATLSGTCTFSGVIIYSESPLNS